MTPEQIKTLAQQVVDHGISDYGNDYWIFHADQLAEFVRLARESALEEAAYVAEAGFKCAKDGYQIADDIRGLKNE